LRFTLRQLRYFVGAAETGSITLASEQLHISQPSISAAISALEKDYGIQLFVRHHAQGLSLTPQGQHLLRVAKGVLREAGELEATALALASKVSGVLEIGCLSTLFPLLVPELVQSFRAKYDGAEMQAVSLHQPELMERLGRGEIALALTYDLDLPPEMEFIVLARLPPYAFVAAKHRLAQRQSVSIEDLAAEPYLLLDMPTSRDYFLSLFAAAGVTPRIVGRFEQLDVIRSLAARGEGFGLANVQPRNRASLDGHPMAYLKLRGDPRALVLGIVVAPGLRRTKAMDAFIELCRELIRDGHIPGTG
jgi:DNA-binding transcriptional LysR family regulator